MNKLNNDGLGSINPIFLTHDGLLSYIVSTQHTNHEVSQALYATTSNKEVNKVLTDMMRPTLTFDLSTMWQDRVGYVHVGTNCVTRDIFPH